MHGADRGCVSSFPFPPVLIWLVPECLALYACTLTEPWMGLVDVGRLGSCAKSWGTTSSLLFVLQHLVMFEFLLDEKSL